MSLKARIMILLTALGLLAAALTLSQPADASTSSRTAAAVLAGP